MSGVRRTERRTGCGKDASWLRIDVVSRFVVRLFEAISSTFLLEGKGNRKIMIHNRGY